MIHIIFLILINYSLWSSLQLITPNATPSIFIRAFIASMRTMSVTNVIRRWTINPFSRRIKISCVHWELLLSEWKVWETHNQFSYKLLQIRMRFASRPFTADDEFRGCILSSLINFLHTLSLPLWRSFDQTEETFNPLRGQFTNRLHEKIFNWDRP